MFRQETTMTYGPSFARTRRPPRGDDVRAERAPRVRGVHEALWGMPGVHVAHFNPMRLPAWNSLHPPKSPVMPPHGPHVTLRVVLGGREAQVDPSGAPARDRPARRQLDGGPRAPPAPKGKIEKLRILPLISVYSIGRSPIGNYSNHGQDSKFLNSSKCPLFITLMNHTTALVHEITTVATR